VREQEYPAAPRLAKELQQARSVIARLAAENTMLKETSSMGRREVPMRDRADAARGVAPSAEALAATSELAFRVQNSSDTRENPDALAAETRLLAASGAIAAIDRLTESIQALELAVDALCNEVGTGFDSVATEIANGRAPRDEPNQPA
jgi:hypothetical protein